MPLSQNMSDRPFLASFVPTGERLKRLGRDLNGFADLQQSLGPLALEHARRISSIHGEAARANLEKLGNLWSTPRDPSALAAAASEYATDAAQRLVLTLDVLRDVGNVTLAQWRAQREEHPVLLYEYASVLDGRNLERPVNYELVQILPPPGTAVDPTKRPYMIIDPRAGHGPGIGGFKSDSQVGVALAHGHPVYFVIFRPQPEPGQTLADVTAAEGHFVREITQRHPRAAKPVIIGNCQGGWAAMLLAASIPHVTGPVVANGAPLSYWAGNRGKNPLRYMGGLTGGAWSALLMSDLGNGRLDGANLVLNFEAMNPGNTWWRKYYNLYQNVDTEAKRFAGFERWWSGYYWMNEAEIRWIIENLFVGNRLQKGTALLAGRGPVDLRKIHAPIVVFASHGDDITPPAQALNWIREVYASEQEIAACGQRIVYMVHPDIGHLGIFVSAKVAKKEHERIVSTLEAIEALAPGLYEMRIEEKTGEGINAQFTVSFAERTMAELVETYGGTDDEAPFALVDRVSGLMVDLYEVLARPFVQAVTTPVSATTLSMMHPLRLRRFVLSDQNPADAPGRGHRRLRARGTQAGGEGQPVHRGREPVRHHGRIRHDICARRAGCMARTDLPLDLEQPDAGAAHRHPSRWSGGADRRDTERNAGGTRRADEYRPRRLRRSSDPHAYHDGEVARRGAAVTAAALPGSARDQRAVPQPGCQAPVRHHRRAVADRRFRRRGGDDDATRTYSRSRGARPCRRHGAAYRGRRFRDERGDAGAAGAPARTAWPAAAHGGRAGEHGPWARRKNFRNSND